MEISFGNTYNASVFLLFFVVQVEERKEMGDLIEIGNKYTELKKRGLCLVPLSMVLNYLPQ